MSGAPTIHAIQSAVAARFGLDLAEMWSDRRQAAVAQPRQLAMYLAHRLTLHSKNMIGRAFHRDRTTILHAIDVVQQRLAIDPDLADAVRQLEGELGGPARPQAPGVASALDTAEAEFRSELRDLVTVVFDRVRASMLRDPLGALRRLSDAFPEKIHGSH